MSTSRKPHRRIALVIGNGSYHNRDIPALTSPASDADIISNTLRGLGFEVTLRKNQMRSEMYKSIIEFGQAMPGCETVLFFFAGHGAQVNDTNYLIPVDAALDKEASVPGQAVDLNLLMLEIEKGKCGVNIVILDACRINPVGGKFRLASARGLTLLPMLPKNTAMVFSAEPGYVSVDSDDRYGLLTSGLMSALQGQDLSLERVLKIASTYVDQHSLHVQLPFVDDPMKILNKFDFQVRPKIVPDLPVHPQLIQKATKPTGSPRPLN
jgi:uncharacterized caspase-like protein